MKKLILSIIGLSALAVSANAATVVQWGQSDAYVTGAVDLNAWGSTGATFSTSTNRSPSSSYSTPSGLSGTFYGGGEVVSTSGSGSFAQYRIGNNQADGSNNYDTIRFAATWSGTSVANDQRFVSLVTFNKADFLNGLNSGTTTISGTDTFSLRGTGATSFANSSSARLAILNGSSWFISSDIAGGGLNDNAFTTFSGAFSGLTWFNYDPTTSMATIGTSATPTFNNVQSIGFQINMGSTGTSGTSQAFQFNSFQVTAVPEPTTWALLAGSLTTLMVFRRRRAS